MIRVTRLDKQTMYVNPDHIVSIIESPDTVVTLFNGHTFLIRESAADIINRIVVFRSKILRRSGAVSHGINSMKVRKRRFHRHPLTCDMVFPDSKHNDAPIPLHSRDY